MVHLSASLELDANALSLFYTIEPLLSDAPIILFRGPASSAAAPSISSSRIQCHVFTPAGFQSYSRLAISPSSPLYAAVSCLSREEQGDEVCRELAYSLYKYFVELSQDVKKSWSQKCLTARKDLGDIEPFTEFHAAKIASRMQRIEDTQPIINDLKSALASKAISYIDVDVMLPTGCIVPTSSDWEEETSPSQYGKYADLIQLLGEPAFLPTSNVRRAPSRPTALNRSLKFTKVQKESLRREMCELVDTEENYVEKLQDLVVNVIPSFGIGFEPKTDYASGSRARSGQNLIASIFPRELHEIYSINSTFLTAIRDHFDQTETAAIEDLNRDDSQIGYTQAEASSLDAIGVSSLGKCLADHLPKFKKAYGTYIKLHERIGQSMKLMIQRDPHFATKIQEFGDKRLASLLIEPVQRLPRYSLYIENMTKQLPIKHPALKPLLQAKDIIADICTNDGLENSHTKALARLKQMIKAWPPDCSPKTRLITAIDLVELQPPYNIDEQPRDNPSFIGLLFADIFVLVQKSLAHETAARSLLADVENPNGGSLADPFRDRETGLVFSERIALSDFKSTEMNDNQLLQMLPCHTQSQRQTMPNSISNIIRIFYVGGIYERRVARFTKELTKARIEGRFPEKDRENTKWQIRELECKNDRFGLISAIFEDDKASKGSDRGRPALTKLLIDPEKHKSLPILDEDGVDAIASLTVASNGFYRLEIDSVFTPKTKDFVTGGELITVITKRLYVIAQLRGSARNPQLTNYLLQHYETILRSLRLASERLGRSPSRTKSLRQHSPVKALANLFAVSSSKSQQESSSMSTSASQLFNSSSKLHLASKSVQESITSESKVSSPTKTTATVVTSGSVMGQESKIGSLETVLETLVLALRSRKGNVIGRVITNRSCADEAIVNQLYNGLLEQPANHEIAAHASVDVLFAGFEQFLKVAWQERMGPVLSKPFLDELQQKSSTLSPIDFEEYLIKSIDDMVPQNRRALRGIIGLLIDLLDGTSNDGDRGSLMATITEIVVSEGNSHDYMPLFDRLVEEHELILNGVSHAFNPQPGSTTTRSSHHTTGSLSSKASSWSKRLGFGSLGRKNGKADTSTNSRPSTQSGRGMLDRTRSVDWSKSASPLSRPGSRDRPPTAETTGSNSRPGTGKSWDQVEPLRTLRETSSQMPRKKRRSSLSDIDNLPSVNTSPFWNSPSARRPENSPLVNRPGGSPLRQETPSMLSRPRPRLNLEAMAGSPTPLSPSHTPFLGRATQSGVATVTPAASPTRSNALRHRPAAKKENVVPGTPSNELSPPPSSTLSRAQSSPTRHHRSPSLVPGPRGPLTERNDSGNTPPPGSALGNQRANSDKDALPARLRTPSPSPTKALQVRPCTQTPQASRQTPARLPERIQDQRSAIGQAQAGLLEELAKIGAEMATAPLSPSRTNSYRQENVSGGTGTTPRKENFEGRLRALETKIPHLFRNLENRTKLLEAEMSAQLKEKDVRIKELERLLAK